MNGTAYLSNIKDIISFAYGNKVIRFRGPYSLDRFESVNVWDNGYIVVMAKYFHTENLVEDYIDLIPILENLYIDANSFLVAIKKVEVQYA